MNKYVILSIAGILCGAAANAQLSVPGENPEDWLLAFVDVETTGLQPGYHEIIDIGVVVSDPGSNELARTFLRILPAHPERASGRAMEVNAFSMERWERLGALSPTVAVDSLIRFHRNLADGRQILMVAYNSHFDAAFLDQLFRSAGESWRNIYYYYILDIPSMAWARGVRLLHGQKLSEYFGIPDEPRRAEKHTGITGADLNYRLYKKILSHRDTENTEKKEGRLEEYENGRIKK